MSDEEKRIEQILPELRKRVDSKIEAISEQIPVDKLVGLYISHTESPEERMKKEKETKALMKAILPIWLRPMFEMNEMVTMAKCGLVNMLSALGHTPKVDGTLKGCSGNKYNVSIVADAPERLLIADQTLLSSAMMLEWLKIQMPKTFDSFKPTVADFFKYLDIFYEVIKKKPTVYWIHDYKISKPLAEETGFSMSRLMRELNLELRTLQGMTDSEIKKEMPSDKKIQEFIAGMDASMQAFFEGLGEIYVKTLQSSRLPFNVRLAANSFRIPFLPSHLLDMLEMSILDPKSPSERRTLIGYSYELGLVDFWNPPWPDYAVRVANVKKSTSADMVSRILQGAINVGHEAREIKALDLSPRKLLTQPLEGLEILEQNGLLEIDKQKETFRLKRPGVEYVREVEKRPKKHAVLKALDWVKGHFSIHLPPVEFKPKEKEKSK